jgi:hypothetical protein
VGSGASTRLPIVQADGNQVSITLYDWRTFPQQFAKSRDPDEKTLFRTLTEVVGPTVIEALVVRVFPA